MTKLEQLVEEWKDCRRCPLWERRTQVVFGRGHLPCDILFVGEAPGKSEDSLGEAFIGPAGRLLDSIVDDILSYFEGRPIRVGFTNVIACIPRDETMTKADDPPDESAEACQPRLDRHVKMAAPKLIVAVGRFSQDWLDQSWKGALKVDCSVVGIVHPAAILRAPYAQQAVMRRSCVVAVRDAIRKYLTDEADLRRAVEEGVAAAEACAATAEESGWDRDAAAEFIVAYLRDNGPTSGEKLVSEASKQYKPHDDRAFGTVFLSLSRRGIITKVGHAQRTKGHGTHGALIWTLAGGHS